MFYLNQPSLLCFRGPNAGWTHAYGYWSMLTLLSTKLSSTKLSYVM